MQIWVSKVFKWTARSCAVFFHLCWQLASIYTFSVGVGVGVSCGPAWQIVTWGRAHPTFIVILLSRPLNVPVKMSSLGHRAEAEENGETHDIRCDLVTCNQQKKNNQRQIGKAWTQHRDRFLVVALIIDHSTLSNFFFGLVVNTSTAVFLSVQSKLMIDPTVGFSNRSTKEQVI